VIEKSILSVLYLKKSLQTLSIRNNFVNDEFEEMMAPSAGFEHASQP